MMDRWYLVEDRKRDIVVGRPRKLHVGKEGTSHGSFASIPAIDTLRLICIQHILGRSSA